MLYWNVVTSFSSPQTLLVFSICWLFWISVNISIFHFDLCHCNHLTRWHLSICTTCTYNASVNSFITNYFDSLESQMLIVKCSHRNTLHASYWQMNCFEIYLQLPWLQYKTYESDITYIQNSYFITCSSVWNGMLGNYHLYITHKLCVTSQLKTKTQILWNVFIIFGSYFMCWALSFLNFCLPRSYN